MRGREKFQKYKIIIHFCINITKILPRKIRLKMYYFFKKTQGNKGFFIRYILLKGLIAKCGDNVSIHPDVYIFNMHNLEIGDNVSIHPMCYIECGDGKIKIGNDVSIAHGVTILAVSHSHNNIDTNIKDQGIETGATIIKNNVWIGAKATILMGRIIEDGAIVGANALVSKNVDKNTIVGGVPNRVIKERR